MIVNNKIIIISNFGVHQITLMLLMMFGTQKKQITNEHHFMYYLVLDRSESGKFDDQLTSARKILVIFLLDLRENDAIV